MVCLILRIEAVLEQMTMHRGRSTPRHSIAFKPIAACLLPSSPAEEFGKF